MSSETPVRTRFAPSPTGHIHLGNARTALFNHLYARRHGGAFVLRIEDTDAARQGAGLETAILEDLAWLGLHWHEGPDRGGPHAPYRQSARGRIYARHYRRLEEEGRAYPCFCGPEELERQRAAARAAGRPPRYAGTCARLAPEAARARLEAGERPVLRFRVPEDGEIRFDDLVRGPQRFRAADIGDFVIRRSDGTPAFFFSNAVDDAEMAISHVLRGEDHLANTPRQILILEALGLEIPRYGHTALLVGPKGAPLSKRRGALSLESLRRQGYLPLAVCNFLARLGHPYPGDRLLDLDALARDFDPARLSRAPARLDMAQLDHWQALAVRALDDGALWRWLVADPTCGAALEARVGPERRAAFVAGVRDNVLRPADALALAELLYAEGDPVPDPGAREALASAPPGLWRTALEEAARAEGFDEFGRGLSARTGLRGRALFLPLRAALTGRCHGPRMQTLWDLLGPERVRQRLEAARDRAASDGSEHA